ncbi:MAG: glycosyltransferase family 39 protein [Aggregatilineales bacterium]
MTEQGTATIRNYKAPRGLICVGISLLILYVLLGVARVPFHGDESTILYMAKDWFRLREAGIGALFYQPMPTEPMPQVLRLINGTLAPFSYGIVLNLAGLDDQAINGGWDWGSDWWQNQYYGHFPRPEVLFIGRWTSALSLCLALALFFASARLLIGAQLAFWAVLLVGLAPAVLLNGRRAMFEGAAFLGAALVWYAAARVVVRRARLGSWLFLGVACGLALAAKHTNVLLVAPIFVALAWQGRAHLWQSARSLLLATLIAIVTFLALNPSWWSAPLSVPREVLHLRSETLAHQNAVFGRPLSLAERLEALIAFPLGAPQYFEDTNNDWAAWLADSIDAYERGVSGVAWYAFAPLVYGLLVLGVTALMRLQVGALIGAALTGIGAALLITNTLMWQRYYLLLSFPLALVMALGLARLGELLRRAGVIRRA